MIFAAFAAASMATSAFAEAPTTPNWPELGVEASIFLPDRYIRNFEADDDKGIWIEDIQRRWYYGVFKGRCSRLQHAPGIGYDTRGSTRFDRSSIILMGDDFCELTSFVTAEKPLPRKERKLLAREAAAKAKAEAAN